MNRVRRVRVPASTANLGPGYDVLAAAVSLYLELEVTETGGELRFELQVLGIHVRRRALVLALPLDLETARDLLVPGDQLLDLVPVSRDESIVVKVLEGTTGAAKEDPDRPVFRGNGPDDYVCVECGNVLAESMHDEQMTFKVRVKCGVCKTVNVSATDWAKTLTIAGGASWPRSVTFWYNRSPIN